MGKPSRKHARNLPIHLPAGLRPVLRSTMLSLTVVLVLVLLLPAPIFAEGTIESTRTHVLEVPFKLGTVSQVAKLVGDDGSDLPGDPDDQFGESVAVDGDTAVVGVPNKSAVHVFTLSIDGWTLQQSISGSEASANGAFGTHVDLSGDTLIAADDNTIHVFVRSGDVWTFEETLAPSDLSSIGTALAIDGDTVVAGSELADTPDGEEAGAAYVFVRSGTSWSEEAILTASDAFAEDRFGNAVTISDETVVIGAARDNNVLGLRAGQAYVFVRSGTSWNEEALLAAGDGAAFDGFGSSVQLSGDRLVVGAAGDDHSGLDNPGSAYLFERSLGSWSEVTKLIASDASEVDGFGTSAGLEGSRLVIGTATDDFGPTRSAAYVFEESLGTWTETLKLIAGDPATTELFAQSVAISGDWIFVGDPLNDTPAGNDAGAAYAFQRTSATWSEVAKLAGIGTARGDLFGITVAMSGRTLVVGALSDDNFLGVAAGAAYVFTNAGTGWLPQAKLTASDGEASDLFGTAVAIEGDRLVVSANRDSHSGRSNAGSAYVFERSGGVWTEVAKLIVSDPQTDEFLGTSLALSGDTVVAGAPLNNVSPPLGGDAGRAVVFVRSPSGLWNQEASLTAINFEQGARLGTTVAIAGNLVAAGAPRDVVSGDTNHGSVSVFERSAGVWTEVDVLFGSDTIGSDQFGEDSLDIAGDTLVVASGRHNLGPELDAGAVYVFDRSGTGWNEVAKLTSDQPLEEARFGSALALERNILVVGANRDPGAAADEAGAVYIFSQNNGIWTQQDRLTADDGATGDSFGFAVAVSEDKILVGSPASDLGGVSNPGGAYVFSVVEPLFSDSFESGDLSAWTGD